MNMGLSASSQACSEEPLLQATWYHQEDPTGWLGPEGA